MMCSASGARINVAYFAPDMADPAVHRRVKQLRHAGHAVRAFAFARDPAAHESSGFVSLGPLAHRSRATRLIALGRALTRLWTRREFLARMDIYWARNLDNAFLAMAIRRMTGTRTPIVYEVLDINRSCIGNGHWARLMRRLEGWLLSRVSLLVVSSPHYVASYYLPYFNYAGPWILFENKIPRYACTAHRFVDDTIRSDTWKIGWFGFLDDMKGWRALCHLAERFPQDVSIYVRGRPYGDFDTERFMDDVARLTNVVYGGPYKSPDDLPALYNEVDLVWSVDLNDPEGNSRWLLTNATYEALYFDKPIITISGTAIGDFIAEHDAGWCLGQNVDEDLYSLIDRLDRTQYNAKCAAIAAIERNRLLETDEIEKIIEVCRSPQLRSASQRRCKDPYPAGMDNSINLPDRA